MFEDVGVVHAEGFGDVDGTQLSTPVQLATYGRRNEPGGFGLEVPGGCDLLGRLGLLLGAGECSLGSGDRTLGVSRLADGRPPRFAGR